MYEDDYVDMGRCDDVEIGLTNVKLASENLRNIRLGDEEIVNVLKFESLSRYINKDKTTLNIPTVFGDIVSAIVALNDSIADISKKISDVESAVEELNSKMTHFTDIRTSDQSHITALENNLRALRETLTYEEIKEVDEKKAK